MKLNIHAMASLFILFNLINGFRVVELIDRRDQFIHHSPRVCGVCQSSKLYTTLMGVHAYMFTSPYLDAIWPTPLMSLMTASYQRYVAYLGGSVDRQLIYAILMVCHTEGGCQACQPPFEVLSLESGLCWCSARPPIRGTPIGKFPSLLLHTWALCEEHQGGKKWPWLDATYSSHVSLI